MYRLSFILHNHEIVFFWISFTYWKPLEGFDYAPAITKLFACEEISLRTRFAGITADLPFKGGFSIP